ncbi:MAG: hypothetical protein JZU50_14445 [Desulfobulbaceae bacterium]|nr:hypothetical protein [Desulfobulbaceae bacterium]
MRSAIVNGIPQDIPQVVRVGVVKRPTVRAFGGHSEILPPRERYGLIGHKALLDFCGAANDELFRNDYRGWVEEALQN